ncbi:MAG: Holliday junction ATP-dependent DNA helicase RuvB [Legionellaceae bacterium]
MNNIDDKLEMEQPFSPLTSSFHQVLARKWRPRNFKEMVGQEPILRALINALDHKRLHHAYLFTGTRGIGKTTLSRILAKCLNCKEGITSTPCGNCEICQAVDEGKFIDLIEVDAASRTKVEDTRDLLENIPYLPTQGRFKIYLIDEVHMLSGHSFNALLKTLEEPPPHVKFLLATTDPQRLPITILSRCLQFQLKQLPSEQIAKYISHILNQEIIPFEPNALNLLADAADGSVRDALSLLDQAIAYSPNLISEEAIRGMLGTIERKVIWEIIDALVKNNSERLMNNCFNMAENAIDFSQALSDLLSCFHEIAIAQAIPSQGKNEFAMQYSTQLTGEELQLFYQIGLIGKRDLPLAPTPRIGFEMALLRMLSFYPNSVKPFQILPKDTVKEKEKEKEKENTLSFQTSPSTPTFEEQPRVADIALEKKNPSEDIEWSDLLAKLNLSGLAYTLASHCFLKEISEGKIHLMLDTSCRAILTPKLQENLNQTFNHYFNKKIKLIIEINSDKTVATPAILNKQKLNEQQQVAITAIESDPVIHQLTQSFNASIDLNSIKLKRDLN